MVTTPPRRPPGLTQHDHTRHRLDAGGADVRESLRPPVELFHAAPAGGKTAGLRRHAKNVHGWTSTASQFQSRPGPTHFQTHTAQRRQSRFRPHQRAARTSADSVRGASRRAGTTG